MNLRGLGVPRPRSIRTPIRTVAAALATTLIVTLLTTVTLAPAQAAQVRTASMASAADTYEQRVQRLVNKRRAARGLPRLRLARCADGTAENWSRHLASTDKFYHQSMSYLLSRCNASYAGETLGRGTMSPRRLVRLWMRSSTHRAVLISRKSRRIGVGVTPDKYGRWVVAANFIRF